MIRHYHDAFFRTAYRYMTEMLLTTHKCVLNPPASHAKDYKLPLTGYQQKPSSGRKVARECVSKGERGFIKFPITLN